MNKSNPIPVTGHSGKVKPRFELLIRLFYDPRKGINWIDGEPVSKEQLEAAIDQCRGQRLPNDVLPSLAPGDVVALSDGYFWINGNWEVIELPLACSLLEKMESLKEM